MDTIAGAYTMPITLALTLEQRRRIEQAIRMRRLEPADFVSAIVAGSELERPVALPDRSADQLVPVRVFVGAERRAALFAAAQRHDCDPAALISAMVAEYARELPDPDTPLEREVGRAEDRGAYRRELNRLRRRRSEMAGAAPAWLDLYIADLEAYLGQDG